MFSKIFLDIILATALFFAGEGVICRQASPGNKIRLIFYNVENLFDTIDNPLTEDDEFLPSGTRRWTDSRYLKKLNAIYKVISAAGGWEAPALIGMCEVENRKVIEDLLVLTPLGRYGDYRIIHEDSPDPRGIDVCLIYRPDRLRLVDYKYLYPVSFRVRNFRTRSVLYSRWLAGKDTMHIFLNHWPSRRRGVLAEEVSRRELAEMVRKKADSLFMAQGDCAKIIITGDFNCLPDDREMKILTMDEGNKISSFRLVNLSVQPAAGGEGSFRYQGLWEMPDQVIVSGALLSSCQGIHTGQELFSVFRHEAFMVKDRKLPGLKPFSTYYGFAYEGGFSDHLPVILDLILPD